VGLSFNTYPGRIFPGVVKTVGWGVYQGQAAPSGNLPAVHEPQNWIKLAQRFQVWVTPQTDLPPFFERTSPYNPLKSLRL
jgi:multidrug resistance efflux pump